jgi:hypothetical protein
MIDNDPKVEIRFNHTLPTPPSGWAVTWRDINGERHDVPVEVALGMPDPNRSAVDYFVWPDKERNKTYQFVITTALDLLDAPTRAWDLHSVVEGIHYGFVRSA